MLKKKRLFTSIFLLLSTFASLPLAQAGNYASFQISGIVRIKQLTNYCGPATLASVLCFYGEKTTQEEIGAKVYNAVDMSTNGADLLVYARDKGYAAYSWNTSVEDVKKKLAKGFPVIVLQQNSIVDISGHFRILTGFNDATRKFSVVDPYYDNIKELSYSECDLLWRRMGYWALIVLPVEKDIFKSELDDSNPVVHMDLSSAYLKNKDYERAASEAKIALRLQPNNPYAKELIKNIKLASGTG